MSRLDDVKANYARSRTDDYRLPATATDVVWMITELEWLAANNKRLREIIFAHHNLSGPEFHKEYHTKWGDTCPICAEYKFPPENYAEDTTHANT